METPLTVSVPCAEDEAFLLPRACRPFRSGGVPLADPLWVGASDTLAKVLKSASGPVLFVRPGAWPTVLDARLPLPSVAPSALLLGAVSSGPEAARWEQIQGACGGNLRALPWLARWRGLPPAPLYLIGKEIVPRLAKLLRSGMFFDKAVTRLALWTPGILAARHPVLDCAMDPALRVLQAITSIQRGGAERVCLDLAAWLPRTADTRCAVAVLGPPGRHSWPAPDCLIDLSSTPRAPDARAAAIARAADAWGADVVHLHLLSAATAIALKAKGLPVIATLHNEAVAWPTGTTAFPAESQADLLLGCSRTSAAEIRRTFQAAAPPIRALPNGVRHDPLPPSEAASARARLRAAWGFSSDDVILLAVANPRPQKRLETLPAIARAAALADPVKRRFRVVVAGSPGIASPGAAESMQALRAAAESAPPGDVLLLGDVPDPRPLMAAADALVCPSAHEGLSLAWLEALREGLPITSAQVGAAEELAREAPLSFHLAPGGDDAALAAAVLRAIDSPRPTLPVGFSARAMAIRAAALCRRVAARKASSAHRPRRAGVWIITCNLSLGGAQSSCRRLLEEMRARGLPARCAVVEEPPDRPTFGRRALQAAGVTVHAVPPTLRPTAQAHWLLARMDADPPEAVLFWNLPPVLRVLLADLLLGDARCIDVSPGEMSFRSLATFFADPAARAGLPYPDARAYGELLHAAVVKYRGEADVAKNVLGCPVEVIPNGVPIPAAACPRPLAAQDGGLIAFGTAARLSPDKRLEEVIESFRLALPRLPAGSRLLIAGESDGDSGKYARALRRSCRGLPVRFLGRLDEGQIRTRLHRALDIFVMASRPAGCPNASLEAMASGLPIVATDWGGAVDQVLDGATGLLVPDGDPAAFADAMVRLARNPHERKAMAIAARERAEAHFSVPRMADGYARLFLSA